MNNGFRILEDRMKSSEYSSIRDISFDFVVRYNDRMYYSGTQVSRIFRSTSLFRNNVAKINCIIPVFWDLQELKCV